MQKIYLAKQIKDFRKDLENILHDKKTKMQDLEVQNSYYRELAKCSEQIKQIMSKQNPLTSSSAISGSKFGKRSLSVPSNGSGSGENMGGQSQVEKLTVNSILN